MNIWENAVITQQGLALQSKLIAGNTLDITKVQIGTGTVSVPLLYKQTALQDVKKTLSQVTSITYPEEGKCAIKINITNDDVTSGYTAQQIGFFADDPDDGEILYFIAQAESGQGTVVPSKTEMPGFSTEWTFTFQYGQADNVSVTVDPSNTVSQSEMESYLSKTIDDLKGDADGLASLDSDGKIPTSQLPSYDAEFSALMEKYGYSYTMEEDTESGDMTIAVAIAEAYDGTATMEAVVSEDETSGDITISVTTVIDGVTKKASHTFGDTEGQGGLVNE